MRRLEPQPLDCQNSKVEEGSETVWRKKTPNPFTLDLPPTFGDFFAVEEKALLEL